MLQSESFVWVADCLTVSRFLLYAEGSETARKGTEKNKEKVPEITGTGMQTEKCHRLLRSFRQRLQISLSL